MHDIPISEAAAGQVVAADVVDESGQALIFAGAVLNAKIISSLKKRGISIIKIFPCAKADEPSAVDDEQMEQVKRYTDFLFRHCDKDMGVVQALYEISLFKQQSSRKFALSCKK